MNEAEDKLIAVVADRFRKLKQDGFSAMESEEAVKHGVILPVLQELGWSVFDPKECKPEYGLSGKGRVDYALLLKSRPVIFIEAKKVGASLSGEHQEQLLNYAFHEGVKLAVLTNGTTWEFYLPLTSGVWSERKVYSIDLEHQDVTEAATRMVMLLSRQRVASGQAEEYAKELHQSRQRKERISEAMPEAWKRLMQEPNEFLADLLAEETEAVCGFKPDSSQVSKFLRNELKVIEEREAVRGLTIEPPKPRGGRDSYGRVRGGITNKELVPFILTALLDLGGSAHRNRVKEIVHDRLKSRLTDDDYSTTSQGHVRWSHSCDWTRYQMKQAGLIKHNSPRGFWELSDKGVKEAQRIADRLNRN